MFDYVDLDKPDEFDSDAASVASGVSARASPPAIEITDAQVLDLFVVFGKPVRGGGGVMRNSPVLPTALDGNNSAHPPHCYPLLVLVPSPLLPLLVPPPPVLVPPPPLLVLPAAGAGAARRRASGRHRFPQFALNNEFMRTGIVSAALQGGFMGFACLAFFNFFDWTSKSWLGAWDHGTGPAVGAPRFLLLLLLLRFPPSFISSSSSSSSSS